MKDWNRKFMNRGLGKARTGKCCEPNDDVKSNASNAQKLAAIPQELWMELTEEIARRNESLLARHGDDAILLCNTVFMAGFVVGWVERGNKTPKPLKR